MPVFNGRSATLPQNNLRVLNFEDASQEVPESGRVLDNFIGFPKREGFLDSFRARNYLQGVAKARKMPLDTIRPTSEADQTRDAAKNRVSPYSEIL